MSKILATLEIAKQTGVKCKLSKPSLLRSELPAHLSLEENCKQIVYITIQLHFVHYK